MIQSGKKSVDVKSLEGRTFRFVVSSPEDAAAIIKERLGDTARVVSVKQVSGQGIARFLSSPQLEVIVTVPKSNENNNAQDNINSIDRKNEKKQEENIEKNTIISQDHQLKNNQEIDSYNKNEKDLKSVLIENGFDRISVEGFRNILNLDNLNSESISKGLGELVHWLKGEYASIEQPLLTNRVAFVGLSGVGTTTALCKQIAFEHFVNQRKVTVLKLDFNEFNADDALSTFCDAVGIQIIRDIAYVENIDQDSLLYVDFSGKSLTDGNQWDEVKQILDKLNITSRVLVLNAAYNKSILKMNYRLGDHINATHAVFTHIDEVLSCAELIPFVLYGKLPVLFLSNGKEMMTSRQTDVMTYVLSKSFPSVLVN